MRKSASRIGPVEAFQPGPGGHDFGAAVDVFEVELALEAGVFAIMVAQFAEAHVAAVPAIGQNRAQGIVTQDESGRSHHRPGSRLVCCSRSSRG